MFYFCFIFKLKFEVNLEVSIDNNTTWKGTNLREKETKVIQHRSSCTVFDEKMVGGHLHFKKNTHTSGTAEEKPYPLTWENLKIYSYRFADAIKKATSSILSSTLPFQTIWLIFSQPLFQAHHCLPQVWCRKLALETRLIFTQSEIVQCSMPAKDPGWLTLTLLHIPQMNIRSF